MRSAFALRLTVALVVATPALGGSARAVAPAEQTASVMQTFRGGGSGHISVYSGELFASFTSSGQLGQGRMYLNPDTGLVTFKRSDGIQLRGTMRMVVHQGCEPVAFESCDVVDLDGTDDITHVHMLLAATALGDPGLGVEVQASFLMSGTLTLTRRIGYLMVDAAGTTYGFGDAPNLGGMTPQAGVVVTSMSATPSGRGYWLFTSKGRAIPFGDATFFGDMHGSPLVGHIVGSIATPSGNGYYMVAADGGVFAFGDAKFHGSTGNLRLNQPVVGLVPTADNAGYWLVARDGGVFSFDAPFHGSMGATPLNQPVVSMARYGDSYMMVAGDGGIFDFSKQPFFGSLAGTHLSTPIVGMTATG